MIPEKNLFPDPEYKNLGDAGAIKTAIELYRPQYFFVINGDLFTIFDLNKFFMFCEKISTREDVWGVIIIKKFRSHLGILQLEERENMLFIKSFEEKPLFENFYSSCGMYFLFPERNRISGFDFAKDYLSVSYKNFAPYVIQENQWFAIETLKDKEQVEKFLD